ncbi:VCBS repeat-containing protein, partial [candidate division KSB1 bacterium]|nr:VCBS repeat-containing protein [candidate division KSB1 bacterium]
MSRFSVHPWQNSFGRIAFFIGLFAVAALAQNLRFQDVTNSARVSTPNDPNGYGHGVAAGDFNNDGLPDIYVVNYTALNALFLNNGNGTFTEAAVSGNVAHTTTLQDRGVAAADYDDDGDLDLYIASGGYQDNLLFRNNGNGSFSEIANSVGLRNYEMQGESVSWGDYDGDGDLDLFLTSYENPCKLFRQNSDHTFSEVTDASGLGGIAESVQSVFFDLELDGDLDIFISRGENIANSLFVNRGNGVFVDEAASRNITDPAPHGQGVTVSDYDNDGDLDIYMCDDRGPNRLYRNDNGSFDEVAEQAGVDDDSRSLGCLFADFNNDGWPDLYVINFGTNRLYRNNGNGTFDDVTSGSGADNSSRGYGSAVLDY